MQTRRLVSGGVAALLATVGAGATSVGAHEVRTIVVHPGHSIQAAIDSAAAGDTVLVLPGIYHRSVQITTDDLTLRGAASGGTVLEPPAAAPPKRAPAPTVAWPAACVSSARWTRVAT